MKKALRAVFILIVTVGFFSQSATAQRQAQNPDRPDVLALVFLQSSGAGEVSLTYPGLVPHARVTRDVQALLRAAGWQAQGIQITDERPPVAKSIGKMTAVTFDVAVLLSPSAHFLPVEPFADALSGYHHINLTYFTSPGFIFQGLTSYADNHVRIALDRRGTTYTYQIYVKDNHYKSLDLPVTQIQADSGSGRMWGRRGVRPWLVAIVALAAVGAGLLVYALLARNA